MTELRSNVCPKCGKAHSELESCLDYILARDARDPVEQETAKIASGIMEDAVRKKAQRALPQDSDQDGQGSPAASDMTCVYAVATAIEKALSRRAYGLYDYSKYPGIEPPYVVTDERTGFVWRFTDIGQAQRFYEKLVREHVASAAIMAMTEWMQADLLARMTKFGLR